MSFLTVTDHRPWPLPNAPWVMAQSWHDLLFAHWPVPVEEMRSRIPTSLDVDIYRGQAWIGVVPFRMTGVRLRGTPSIPWFHAFPEINVRTYVVKDGKPGVYFFSLDATNAIAVAVARRWFHLPYFHARMSLTERDGLITYESRRTDKSSSEAEFSATYRPTGDPFAATSGTIEHWLTERYCLYALDQEQRLYRGEIHHPRWPLQSAEATIRKNTMTRPIGLSLPDVAPLLHFSQRQDVVVWNPK